MNIKFTFEKRNIFLDLHCHRQLDTNVNYIIQYYNKNKCITKYCTIVKPVENL